MSGLLAAGLAACAPPQPTPYQPLRADARAAGGYEETRLQDDVFRVSFRGNPYTGEEAVIDMLYLRCAELTLAAGYTHFEVSESFGTFQYRLTARQREADGMLIAQSGTNGMWMRLGRYDPAPVYIVEPATRLAMFVIRMHKQAGAPDGAAPRYDANALAGHLASFKPSSGAE